jgi:hypothetical protein
MPGFLLGGSKQISASQVHLIRRGSLVRYPLLPLDGDSAPSSILAKCPMRSWLSSLRFNFITPGRTCPSLCLRRSMGERRSIQHKYGKEMWGAHINHVLKRVIPFSSLLYTLCLEPFPISCHLDSCSRCSVASPSSPKPVYSKLIQMTLLKPRNSLP